MNSFLTDNAGVIVNNKGEMKGNIIANILPLTMYKIFNNVFFQGGKMFEESQITEVIPQIKFQEASKKEFQASTVEPGRICSL